MKLLQFFLLVLIVMGAGAFGFACHVLCLITRIPDMYEVSLSCEAMLQESNS